MMRMAVYTAVIGDNTDHLKPPAYGQGRWRHVCFTDRDDVLADGWEIYRLPEERDKRLMARRIKMLPHVYMGDHGASLWIDAAFHLLVDPMEVMEQEIGRGEIIATRHPSRSNIVDEAKVIERMGMVDGDVLRAQIDDYRNDGYDVDGQKQITVTGYMIRRNTARVRRFNDLWWSQLQKHCWRDQMSVDYAAWKTGVSITYMDYYYTAIPYAQWYRQGRGPR